MPADHRERGRARLGVRRRRGRRLGLERGFGRADALKALLLVGNPAGYLVAIAVGTMLGIFRGVGRLRLGQPVGDLGRQFGLGALHPAAAHRLVLARVRLELGAIQRDMAELDQPGPPAQPQHLSKQPGQSLKMAPPEVADGAAVRPLHAGHRPHVEAFRARLGDLPRRVDALGVGIQQQRHHHRRVVWRLAPLLPFVICHDRRKVHRRAHHLPHQLCRMARRHEVVDRRRQQPHLVHVPRPKGLAHAQR
jgi:hypothetical protein